MPPSPSLRRSSSMDPPVDSHKRGRSLEGGLSFKEKDDDLALFNEMQDKDDDNFLLRPADDFEDIFSSRVKPLPDLMLGINIPARGESSDLLNVEGDKNDYDWLLTPPDSPLFPSLDDEPVPINLVHDGRARSRPISISRTSTMEKRSSRGSPSPQRLSPSPQSRSSTFKGRPSSAPQASPIPLRSGTPSRRPSPSPVKPSTPPPRSSTPPPRRTNTGSSTSVGPYGVRGTSPVRTTRGNSASPKIMAWQSNIPGFSLEAPPNLRTSLADRPGSYVRGSSPASRTSNSSSKVRRQSMSPTASRSISSSHSQERDRFSSYSRGSVVSSGDDDADSLMSTPVSVTERPVPRRGVGSISNSKALTFSKKPTKTFAPSSAPKRSFDSAMRQMDRKSPQNMFRPLLSSVPSSTFYAGKASAAHRAMLSRNSSVTTSSYTSSDQATTSGAHDTEGSDLYQDSTRVPFPEPQDEVFAIDELDVGNKDVGSGSRDAFSNAQLGKPDKDCVFASNNLDSEESEAVDSNDMTILCSICGRHYHADEAAENEDNVCPECSRSVHLMRADQDPNMTHSSSISGATLDEVQDNASQSMHSVDDPSHTLNGSVETQRSVDKSDLNINPTDAQGISVLLLKRSSSLKGPLIHGRTFNSSSASYDELLNTRDLMSSLRSSVGHNGSMSISTSSSVDLASSRHGEMLVQRQLSGRRAETSSQTQSSVSQGFELSTSSPEENPALENAEESQNSDPSVSETLVSEEISRAKDVDNSQASMDVNKGHAMQEVGEKSIDIVGGIKDVEESVSLESSLVQESMMPENEIEVAEDPQCAIPTIAETEVDGSHLSSPGSQMDVVAATEDVEDASVMADHDKDVQGLSLDPSELDHVDGTVDDSSLVTVVEDPEDPGMRRTRSLTLEEATDTILFCSSIVHDLAYNAATIAIDKEKENFAPLEGSRPTITIPEKRTSDRRDPRMSKTQKPRKPEPKSPLTKLEAKNDEQVMVRNVGLPNNHGDDAMKPTKLESKCNCTIM